MPDFRITNLVTSEFLIVKCEWVSQAEHLARVVWGIDPLRIEKVDSTEPAIDRHFPGRLRGQNGARS
jgi:hypothetical protein